MKISILGDLIADFNLRISDFPVRAGDLMRAEYLGLVPGGSCNVAIVAARLGLEVQALGEVGQDRFGRLVRDGLALEGVSIEHVQMTEDAETPVAGVLVDRKAEPAYLGYRGQLSISQLLPRWQRAIQESQAFFCDGWTDHEFEADLRLEGIQTAAQAGLPVFFDPGPGNPQFPLDWHRQAARSATVLLATEDEASRLTGIPDPLASAKSLLDIGPELVVVKRGVAGCLLLTPQATEIAPGLPVEAVDATGAGDSLDAAVIYGFMNGIKLEALGALANAAGAAKVRKLGTGHNLPTLEEIGQMLEQFEPSFTRFLPQGTHH